MKNRVAISPVLITYKSCCAMTLRSAEIFSEEIALKTNLSLERGEFYLKGRSNIVLCSEAEFTEHLGELTPRLDSIPKPQAEGFRIFTLSESDASRSIFVVGKDERGVFYGMGKLLRLLTLTENGIYLDYLQESISQSPQYSMRGHQLGYRDKQNTCPCWTQADYDRYIRDLGLFGANAMELVAPRTDDNLFSRKMQVHPMQMMCDVSRIIKSYAMDVWLWYPNMALDYTDEDTMRREIEEREEVYRNIPYLDAILVPAGDPGELRADEFFRVTGIFSDILHKYHPNATVWIAPQCFDPDDNWMPEFYSNLATQPDWLYGICYGPWNKDLLSEMIERSPDKYKNRVRYYPDITHNFGCQYPLENWDNAFAIFEGRECNNTRPEAMKHIHNTFSPLTLGSVTYSEGIHDDVNKFIWSGQDWDSSQSASDILKEYVRYFIDPTLETELVRAFLGLEKNWLFDGAIELNDSVDDTYRLFCNIERLASPSTRQNYRFLMGLLRAMSDYYVKHKRIYDKKNEKDAIAILKSAKSGRVKEDIRDAIGHLNLSFDVPWDAMIRNYILYLSDQLHEKCGIKLTTKHHEGQHYGRGAYLDLIDFPLSNAPYLLKKLKAVIGSNDESKMLSAIDAMLNRTDPGEGGIYCNVGSKESEEIFKIRHDWDCDPSMHRSPFRCIDAMALRFCYEASGTHMEMPVPEEWLSRIVAYYDTELNAEFNGLDRNSNYSLTVVYFGSIKGATIKLRTADGTVIHNSIERCTDYSKFNPEFEFPLNPSMYKDGKLQLVWQAENNYEGVSINEIFIKKTS